MIGLLSLMFSTSSNKLANLSLFNSLLSNKVGINRYGFVLPMDDCLAQCAIDFGGRSWITWSANFKREKI